MRRPCSEDEVLEHFKLLDRERSGRVLASDFVHLLRGMGEPLSEEDANALLREITIDGDGYVDIQQFVDHMFRTSLPHHRQ
jgi:calmodulin